MRKILIASHGKTASGIKSTVELFTKETEICCIDAYVEGSQDNYIESITDFIQSLKCEDEAYIFTDIIGGSVHQNVIKEVLKDKEKKLVVITNVNVAIVIELLTNPKMMSVEEVNRMVLEYRMIPLAIDLTKVLEVVNETDDDAFLD